jgi:stage II sporulation protein GA (sporulation sigma-E factor processing peptidase)
LTLYLDVIWLLNLLVDSILLWLTGLFLKRQLSLWRVVFGGLVGSLIILLSFSPYAYISGHPLIKLLFSVIMIYIAFGYKRLRYFTTNLLMFYFTTFLTGGIIIGTHYFIGFDPSAESSIVLASIRGFGDPISWIFVMFALPLSWYFSNGRIKSIKTVKIQYDQLVDVVISLDNTILKFRGLIDSGNQLQDPITKQPVMIVSTKGLENKLPQSILALSTDVADLFTEGNVFDTAWSDRMKFIPAQSVGRKSQLLAAIKPDAIILHQGGVEWQVSNGLIVFRAESLSADNSFQAIVHPKMMAEKPIQHVS